MCNLLRRSVLHPLIWSCDSEAECGLIWCRIGVNTTDFTSTKEALLCIPDEIQVSGEAFLGIETKKQKVRSYIVVEAYFNRISYMKSVDLLIYMPFDGTPANRSDIPNPFNKIHSEVMDLAETLHIGSR